MKLKAKSAERGKIVDYVSVSGPQGFRREML